MNPLIIFGACAVIGGFGPWSGGHRVPVAQQRQRLWGGPTGHKYPARGGFRQSLHRPPPTVPMQQQYFGGQTIQMTNNQMRMLHRDGRVVADGVLIEFMQTRLDGFGQVQARVCVTAYDITNTAVSTRCYWDGGHTINIQERDPYNPSRLDGFGAPLNSATRNSLPARTFGLPKERKYPMYVRRPMRKSGDLVFSRTHAINAKGRARQMLNQERISDGQYNRIVGKADRLLARHG